MNKRLRKKLAIVLCAAMCVSTVPVFAQSNVPKDIGGFSRVTEQGVTTPPAIDVVEPQVTSITLNHNQVVPIEGDEIRYETELDSVLMEVQVINCDNGYTMVNGKRESFVFVRELAEGENRFNLEVYTEDGVLIKGFSLILVKDSVNTLSTVESVSVNNNTVFLDKEQRTIEMDCYGDLAEIHVSPFSPKSKIAFFDEDGFNEMGFGHLELDVTGKDRVEVPFRCISYDGNNVTEYTLILNVKNNQESLRLDEMIMTLPNGEEIDISGGRYITSEGEHRIRMSESNVTLSFSPESEDAQVIIDGEVTNSKEFNFPLGDTTVEVEVKLPSGESQVTPFHIYVYPFEDEAGIESITLNGMTLHDFAFASNNTGVYTSDGYNDSWYEVNIETINPDAKVFINDIETRTLKVDARKDVCTIKVEIYSPSGKFNKTNYDLKKDGRYLNALLDLAVFEDMTLDKPFNLFEREYTVTASKAIDEVTARFSPLDDRGRVKYQGNFIGDMEDVKITVYDGMELVVEGLGYDGGSVEYKFKFDMPESEPSEPEDTEDTAPSEPEYVEPEDDNEDTIPATPIEPITPSHWENRIAYSVEYNFLTELIENNDMFKSFEYEFLGDDMFKVTVTLYDGQRFSFHVKQQDYSKSILTIPQVKSWAQESTNYVYANNLFDDHNNKSNIVQEIDIIKGLDLAFVTAQDYMLPKPREFYGYDKYVEGNGRYMPHVANMSSFLRDYTKFYSIDDNMFTTESMTREDLADIVACMLWEFEVQTNEKEFPFTDVEPTEEIKKVYDAGIMVGRTPTKFCPDEEVTFPELMMVLARLHKSTLQ